MDLSRNEQLARFEALIHASRDFIAIVSMDDTIDFLNSGGRTLIGMPDDLQVDRTHISDYLTPEGAILSAQIQRPAIARDGHWDGVSTLRDWRGGPPIPVEISSFVISEDDPTMGGIVVVARDVTDRHFTERSVKSQANLLELIACGTDIGEVLAALAEEIEAQLSDTFCSVLLIEGSGESRVLHVMAAPSLPDAYALAVDRLPVDATASPCSLAAYTSQSVFVSDLLETEAWQDSRELAMACGVRACWSVPILSPVSDETLGTFALYQVTPGLPAAKTLELLERASHLIGIAIDRSQFDERLTHQATHDELTSLPNRTLLMDRLNTALVRHQRNPTAVPVVVFVDLDRLKVVNDSLGHDIGDTLLRDIARRLETRMRPTDTVARFGGDEFVIVAEEANDDRGPIQLVERILAIIAEPLELSGHPITPSASAGVVVAVGYGSAIDVIRDADIAMYRAKHRGGSGYELFNASMRDRALHRLGLEEQIRRGINDDQFRVLYQPIVDLVDQAVVGFEALVRWAHPERGLLGPGAFIDLAEETGLIVDLGEWVLREAAGTVAEWDVPCNTRELVLSVNVSSRQLASASLPGAVAAARSAVSPWSLCLELTESTLMDDTPNTRAVLEQLTSSGTSLSIDDFGTGYSSLSYLTRLPVATLKIDQSFVSALGMNAEAATVAAAIISLAAELGLKAIAEGVETRDQERVLLALGCRSAQGFLFYPPLPAPDASALLPRA